MMGFGICTSFQLVDTREFCLLPKAYKIPTFAHLYA